MRIIPSFLLAPAFSGKSLTIIVWVITVLFVMMTILFLARVAGSQDEADRQADELNRSESLSR